MDVAGRFAAWVQTNEPVLTHAITETAGACDGLLVDLDHRLKTLESLAAKIEQRGVDSVNDALRYRVVFEDHRYAGSVRRFFESRDPVAGHVVPARWRDQWGDSRYRGLNTTWEFRGGLYEVQFHTPASASVAGDAEVHESYKRLMSTRGSEQRRILVEIKARWSHVRRPPGTWPVP